MEPIPRPEAEDGDVPYIPSKASLQGARRNGETTSLPQLVQPEEPACVRDSFYNYYRHMLHKHAPDLRNEKPHVHLSEDAHRSFLLGRKLKTVQA